MKLNFGLDRNDKEAFALLPLGSVKARGWLENQMLLMKEGITGEMEKFPDYIESEWLGKRGENWERGPYYLRGLIALAYTLEDGALIAKAQKWIEAILASSRDGGMFGPVTNEDWWSRMPVLMALRDYLEARERMGDPDDRIIPFIESYFRYQLEHLPSRPLESWARARGGDNIDSVLWLYNRLYDPAAPKDTAWLLELAELLRVQTQDWRRIMNHTTVREHVVNTSQALKFPVLCYQMTGNEEDRSAFERALFNMSVDHGRTDSLPNSDEAARDNRSTRGSELCSIVEGMLSSEIALRVLREGWIGDHLERLAYNALPSGYSYDYSGHVYYILQNQVMATNGYHEFDCDHGDSSAFGAPCGFDCCFSNNHMGWPKFVQSMWLAVENGGIAAAAYGPCSVKHGDISFEESTDYPFGDTVNIVYTGITKTFELSLRIPEWCDQPSVRVNGQLLECEKGSFAKITRVWTRGDKCTLCFPMEIKTVDGYNGSRAVTAGPLIYSYPVRESWSVTEDNSARELKVSAMGRTENREARPAGKWNYAVFKEGMTLSREPVDSHPFTPDSAPSKIRARAVPLPYWKLDSNIAAVQPYGGGGGEYEGSEEITLIPYGCTRLKITHFPKAEGRELIYTPRYVTRSYGSFYEFEWVTLPKAKDYDLRIKGEGEGSVQINGVYTAPVSFEKGELVIKGVKGLELPDAFAFDHRHYNNLRVTGAKVYSLEILPVCEFSVPVITEYSVSSSSVRVRVNADKSFCSFTLNVGERSGEYTLFAEGFKGNTGRINGLESGKEYYISVSAYINGREVFGKELKVTTLSHNEDTRECVGIEAQLIKFYAGVSLKYPGVDGADYYEVWYGTREGEYPRRVSDFIFNPYKGSHCFERDVLSLSLDPSQKQYHLCLKAFKGDCCVASSGDMWVCFDEINN